MPNLKFVFISRTRGLICFDLIIIIINFERKKTPTTTTKANNEINYKRCNVQVGFDHTVRRKTISINR